MKGSSLRTKCERNYSWRTMEFSSSEDLTSITSESESVSNSGIEDARERAGAIFCSLCFCDFSEPESSELEAFFLRFLEVTVLLAVANDELDVPGSCFTGTVPPLPAGAAEDASAGDAGALPLLA